jgi:hypothetical protein
MKRIVPALIACSCLIGHAAQVQKHVDWVKWVGRCELTHLSRTVDFGDETLVIRTKSGRLIASITGFDVRLELARDVTGDGVRDAVIAATGDMCPTGDWYVYAFKLGRSPRNILVFGPTRFCRDIEARDVNGDGRRELTLSDDRVADDYPGARSKAPGLPVYMAYRHGRFVDVTRGCRAALRKDLARSMREFRDWVEDGGAELREDPPVNSERETGFPPSAYRPVPVEFGPPVQCYAISVVCGPRTKRATWERLMRLLPGPYHREMKRFRRGIEQKALAATRKASPVRRLPLVVNLFE